MTNSYDIPVTFEHDTKTFQGYLSPVPGSGGNIYHLMIKQYYRGQLIRTGEKGWQFHSQSGKGKELSEYFGKVVEHVDPG